MTPKTVDGIVIFIVLILIIVVIVLAVFHYRSTVSNGGTGSFGANQPVPACMVQSQCAANEFCNANRICLVGRGVDDGGVCSSHAHCKFGSKCQNGICTPIDFNPIPIQINDQYITTYVGKTLYYLETTQTGSYWHVLKRMRYSWSPERGLLAHVIDNRVPGLEKGKWYSVKEDYNGHLLIADQGNNVQTNLHFVLDSKQRKLQIGEGVYFPAAFFLADDRSGEPDRARLDMLMLQSYRGMRTVISSRDAYVEYAN